MARRRKTTVTVKYSGGYTVWMFILDMVMIPLTGGLWIIWMILR